MSGTINYGGSEFPCGPTVFSMSGDDCSRPGMTLREYAAIKLRVPESGTDWLDEMIRESVRDEFAAKAMQVLLADVLARKKDIDDGVRPSDPYLADRDEISEVAYWHADSMLRARESK